MVVEIKRRKWKHVKHMLRKRQGACWMDILMGVKEEERLGELGGE
jgi:hypothetical protein